MCSTISRKYSSTTDRLGRTGTHDLFALTDRSGRGHPKIVFLVEKLGLKGPLLPNLSRVVDTHIIAPIPRIQHIGHRDHSHIRRVVVIITILIVFSVIRVIVIECV
jgi:hypothetical protein